MVKTQKQFTRNNNEYSCNHFYISPGFSFTFLYYIFNTYSVVFNLVKAMRKLSAVYKFL